MANDRHGSSITTADLNDLKNVKEPRRGTKAIKAIKDCHGDDLRIQLGRETGSVGTWINFKLRGEIIAAMDYFAGVSSEVGPPEGATFYVHPDYL